MHRDGDHPICLLPLRSIIVALCLLLTTQQKSTCVFYWQLYPPSYWLITISLTLDLLLRWSIFTYLSVPIAQSTLAFLVALYWTFSANTSNLRLHFELYIVQHNNYSLYLFIYLFTLFPKPYYFVHMCVTSFTGICRVACLAYYRK
jgi:hypothetical protein